MSIEEIAFTTDIEALLCFSDIDDINALVNYLTDNGGGRLSLNGEVCKRLIKSRDTGHYSQSDYQALAHEIRLFGGNSFLNLFKKEGASYEEIVKDTAKHLKVEYNGNLVYLIEQAILGKILTRAFDDMSEVERKAVFMELGVSNYSAAGPAVAIATICAAKAGGFATFQMAAIVANAVAKALIGRGLTFATTGQVMRTLSLAIGPIGWAITALWTAADLASPAYRVTVPCVVQLAYMRQKAIKKIAAGSFDEC